MSFRKACPYCYIQRHWKLCVKHREPVTSATLYHIQQLADNELEMIRNEAIAADFRVMSRHMAGDIQKNHD
jgi:hypothetical protein